MCECVCKSVSVCAFVAWYNFFFLPQIIFHNVAFTRMISLFASFTQSKTLNSFFFLSYCHQQPNSSYSSLFTRFPLDLPSHLSCKRTLQTGALDCCLLPLRAHHGFRFCLSPTNHLRCPASLAGQLCTNERAEEVRLTKTRELIRL